MIDTTVFMLCLNKTILSTRTKEKEVCYRYGYKWEKEKIRRSLFRMLFSRTGKKKGLFNATLMFY